MTHPPTDALAQPDARIDQVLEALRTTEPSAGMEERIAQRIAARLQQSETHTVAHSVARSPFTVLLNAVKDLRILPLQVKFYATAATALTLLVTLTVLYHRTSTMQPDAVAHFNRETPGAANTKVAQSFSLGSHKNERIEGFLTPAPTQAAHDTNQVTNSEISNADNIGSVATNQVPRGFSLGSHSPMMKTAGVSTPAPDLDTIALAETLAPSHPAPPMPLTAQEQLMLAATRPGQPIQVAALDMARAPFLRAAAEAHEDANLRRYVRTLLAPFAIADELSPTTISSPREINAHAPAPQPPTSLSN